jgi:hypothetical protein
MSKEFVMSRKHKAMATTVTGRSSAVEENVAEERRGEKLTHHEIAERAYSYWEARGREGGSAEEDWLRAIRELTEERQE